MNTTEELPIAAADDSAEAPFDVVKAEDLIPFLASLKESQRRWRRTAVGFGSAVVVLLVLACIQFAGTLMACKLVQDAHRARQDAEAQVRPLESAAQEVQNAAYYTATLQEELKALHIQHRKEMARLRSDLKQAGQHHEDLKETAWHLQERIHALEERAKAARTSTAKPGQE